MRYTPIMATLGYVLSPDGQRVLMIHRNTRPSDIHYGKYNGLGGKLQNDEDVAQCIKREIQEEAGIEVDKLTLCGTISWPGFGGEDQNWFCFVFRIEEWHGTVLESNEEGMLEWVPVSEVLSLNLWPGDLHFLPLVFNREIRQFHGVMPYKDGQPESWNYTVV